MSIHVVLVIVAGLFFLLATAGVGGKINLVGAGLFCWLASTIW